MHIEIPILIGIMLALLGIGFIIGTIVQKLIDDAKLHAEQTRANEYRDTLEQERRENAQEKRETNRRHDKECEVFLVTIDELQRALRGEQLRLDIYKKGGRK